MRYLYCVWLDPLVLVLTAAPPPPKEEKFQHEYSFYHCFDYSALKKTTAL